jgi:hypothetical protein
MNFLARAPAPAEWWIIALVALIPLAALVIGFLILMRITGPPQSTSDASDSPQADPPANKKP